MKTAKDRLLVAIPFFRRAIADAQGKLAKGGKVQLGILATNADGSGNVEMQFDCEEFFADIEELVNAPAQTAEDDMRVDAEKFLQTHGLKE